MRFRPLVLFLVSLASCATSTSPSTPTARERDATGDALRADLAEVRRHHLHNQALLLLALSLDRLDLPDDVRLDIVRLYPRLIRQIRAVRAAKHDLLDLLADGLASNQPDDSRIDKALARLTADLESTREATVLILNHLHDALSPFDRALVADQLAAHPAWWAEANGNEAGTLQVAANDLQLPHQQLARLGESGFSSSLANAPGSTRSSQASLFDTAFRATSFDASGTVPPVDANVALWRRFASFCEVVGPLLSDSQRRCLARRLRALARAYHAV